MLLVALKVGQFCFHYSLKGCFSVCVCVCMHVCYIIVECCNSIIIECLGLKLYCYEVVSEHYNIPLI